SRQGVPVTVLESARQLGGRARCVPFGSYRVDNGQHVMIGAYHAMLELLELLGVAEKAVFLRRPLELAMHTPGGRGVRVKAPPLPAPLHMLAALLGSRGLSPLDRLRALHFGTRATSAGPAPHPDISVQALLEQNRQSPRLVANLWEPLCLAALNTPIADASATLFLRVLRDAFTGTRHNTDLLIPRTDLGTALPQPALDFIEAHHGKVRLGQPVRDLRIGADGVTGVDLANERLSARHVILAVNPVMCRRLLAPHEDLREVTDNLAALHSEPICTVYLQYPGDVRLTRPMAGLVGTTTQWVFDRAVCGQPGLMAAVISGSGPHMQLDNTRLVERVAQELSIMNPHWPAATNTLVLREKRATFASRVGVEALRPSPRTGTPGLWLAGDFTATGLPATLEGAVRSGLECAHAILETTSHTASGLAFC
ncbi:MAG TPA: hydroxysqualene dehydroxylase HpnE, partial [Gammaproteobacteria bacterium]|nr:hydroxysqualene dehydroxylase HpnE [Gammaproteobacteria bacterium]